jgi:hypothetical protein
VDTLERLTPQPAGHDDADQVDGGISVLGGGRKRIMIGQFASDRQQTGRLDLRVLDSQLVRTSNKACRGEPASH